MKHLQGWNWNCWGLPTNSVMMTGFNVCTVIAIWIKGTSEQWQSALKSVLLMRLMLSHCMAAAVIGACCMLCASQQLRAFFSCTRLSGCLTFSCQLQQSEVWKHHYYPLHHHHHHHHQDAMLATCWLLCSLPACERVGFVDVYVVPHGQYLFTPDAARTAPASCCPQLLSAANAHFASMRCWQLSVFSWAIQHEHCSGGGGGQVDTIIMITYQCMLLLGQTNSCMSDLGTGQKRNIWERVHMAAQHRTMLRIS